MRVSYISLGCPKNEIDLEYILGGLSNDFQIEGNPIDADTVIINTCAFIDTAKQESIDHILNLLQIKKDNPHFRVLVTGCLPQRYKDELHTELPDVDKFIETTDIAQSLLQIQDYLKSSRVPQGKRFKITPRHFSYLKIAEGCNNRCSYCAIPLIKGDYESRPFDEIIQEAQSLVQSGVKELIVVAQDTTMYGSDLKNGKLLPDILSALNQINGLQWIRLLYTHPAHWTDNLIDAIARLDKVVKYIDLPIQHISDRILTKMGRGVNKSQIIDLIERVRLKIPGVAIRTSVITGFPGETKEEYKELKHFIQDIRFDRLGVFAYSPEEGTRAVEFEDPVVSRTKRSRMRKLMELQAEISYLNNRNLEGEIIKILIDEIDEEQNIAIGRTEWDAPEIDNSVIVNLPAVPGNFYHVRVNRADVYDLYGRIV